MSHTPPGLNAVVTKHNYLLPKLAKMELSELRLLTFCLAHFDSRPTSRCLDETLDDGTPLPQEVFEYQATVRDLLDIFPGMGKNTAYAVVRQAVRGINSKPFEERYELPDGSTEDVLLYWFTGFRYNNDRGQFTFKLSSDIVNLVLSQDGNFTQFRLKHVYQFKSATTWKMYELLKRWVVAGRWAVDLNELRMAVGLPGKYPTWRDLKKRILDNPIKEINDLSDITVTYEKKKRVRSVSGVVFFINSKKEEARANDPSIVANIGDTNRDVRLLMGVGINQTNAEYLSKLAAEANKDLKVFFDRVVARYEAKTDDKPPKQAYVYKALENEFAPNLFDGQGEAPARKVDLRPKQKATDKKKMEYYKEATLCPHFKVRENTGCDCPVIMPDNQKCLVCNETIERWKTL